MNRKPLGAMGGVLFLTLFICVQLLGQTYVTSGIRGTVVDPTGASIVGAKVMAKGVATGYTREAVTDSTGGYFFALLPVGIYDLTVEMSGFKKYTQTGIALTVNQVEGVNVSLEVGAISQSVQVAAAQTTINTQTSEVSMLLEPEQIQELPLNGRNPISLALLTNGVQAAAGGIPTYLGQGGGTITDTIDGGGAVLIVNGTRAHGTQFNLDGGEFAGMAYDSGLNYPNPDALQEVRFVTGNYGAEFGKLPGGVMNVITKSGSNQFHGSAWEFNRNSALATRGFGNVKAPFLNQNQFGFTAGGPVIKDRLFLFGTAQWLRIAKSDISSGNTPPTVAERSGDLSSYKNPDGTLQTFTDPLTNAPFPGNIIPPDRIDPVAAKLLDLIPLPNQPDGTLYQQLSAPVTNHQYFIKGDYQVSNANRLSAEILRDITSGQQPLSRGGAGGGIQWVNTTGPNFQSNSGNITAIIVNDTHTIRANLLNQARFGYTRVRALNGQSAKVGPTMHDLNPAYPDYPAPLDRPGIWISGRVFASRGVWGTSDTDDYQFSDGINYIRGAHSLKVGGEYRNASISNVQTNNDQGIFWGGLINQTGNPLADFMLGLPLGIISNPTTITRYQHSVAGYIQDDYKVSRRLVVNLGVRYQVAPLWTPTTLYTLSDGTKTNGLSGWRPGQQSQLFPTAPLGVVYAGDKGIPQNGGPTDFSDVAPRFGFALEINNKTSLRGGFGLFHEEEATRYAALGDIGVPFGANAHSLVMNGFAGFPGPNQFPQPALTRNFDFSTLYPLQISSAGSAPIHPKNTVVNQYNLTLERSLLSKMIVSVAYVGNEAHHLAFSRNINPAVYIPGNDSNGLPLSTAANTDQRRILNLALPAGSPSVYGAITQQEDGANSTYNSLQVQARTANFHGLTLLGNYTWSKSIDEVSLFFFGLPSSSQQDPNCVSCDRANSDFDHRHNITFSYVYHTPSLTGALGIKYRAVKAVFDDWELSGVTGYQSGSPFSIASSSTDNSRSGNGKDRANLIGDFHLPSGRSRAEQVNEWFNTGAFTVNPVGTFGTSGRNIIVGPATVGTQLALMKNFPLRENSQFQLRFEFYNAFNQTNLGQPDNTLGSPTFGKILTSSVGRLIQVGGKFTF